MKIAAGTFHKPQIDERKAFEELKAHIDRREALIPIRGYLKLTKTDSAYAEGILLRDLELESAVKAWIGQRSAYELLMERYLAYDTSLHTVRWPAHFPVRVLAGIGPVASGTNVFMFFPDALGISARNPDDFFGVEFIDIWENIFQGSILPCVRRVFDLETQYYVHEKLAPSLDKTLYLAAVFHEIGHRVGAVRVSPEKDPRLRLSDFYFDTLGEISTNTLMATHLQEFPEIQLFVFLQLALWFARKGFKDAPTTARINQDNDAWIGVCLWNRAVAKGALTQAKDGWKLDMGRLGETYNRILSEVDSLGKSLLSEPSGDAQNQMVQAWMRENVYWDPEAQRFHLPDNLVEVYRRCQDISEIPHFSPPLKMPPH